MFINLSNIYFNVDQISEFCADGSGETRIYDSTYSVDGFTSVKESPEQILALIEAEKVKELRDEFAGKVVVGILRTCDETPGTEVNRDDIAMEAYRMADAMLKAREA